MSSSMRNAIQRRNHRERAQPLERQKLGLLEKHKDYSLRAADHKKKQRTLRNLRAKAADRNEDEFYFGMMSRKGAVRGNFSAKGRKWDGIVDGDRGSLKGMELDVSRLLKTQDLGYLRTMRNVAQKDVKGLEERVVALSGTLEGMGGAKRSMEDEDVDGDSEDEFAGLDDDDMMDEEGPSRKKKKFVFSEGVDEREDMLMGIDGEMMDDDGSRVDGENEDQSAQQQQQQRAKSSKAKAASSAPLKTEKERREEKQLLLEKLERRLAAARRKVTVLSRAEQKLELQRAKMAKTATATGSVTKAGKRIKVRERKR